MQNIKMRTGIALPNEPSLNIRTFLLTFMAIIWRRVWITTSIFCEHNKIKISSDVVFKCLKFNIFSDAGIGKSIKPYVRKAINEGFLMPGFYKKNIYATRAVKLYKPAYEIAKLKNRNAEIEFIKKYTLSVFDTGDKNVNEVVEETKDVINDIGKSDDNSKTYDSYDSYDPDSFDTSDSDINSGDNNDEFDPVNNQPCKCKMCELVDSWDVNISLIYSADPFQNVIMKGLTSTLENTNI